MSHPPVTNVTVRSWAKLLDEWGAYLSASGTPPSTLAQRAYHVRRVSSEIGKPLAAVTLDDLTAWLSGNRWAPNTRRSYRASLRAFYAWAMATGRVSSSPAHLLPPVRIPRAKPRPTPEGAYRDALRFADDRERLAILLAAQCGLRRGEIARARREDMEPDLLGLSLRVEGKGGHVRLVPLPIELAATIAAHADGWLFPSTHGGHLTPHHLGKIVSRRLPGSLTTHTLRHRCATVSYAATRDLRAVQELLGHAKPETTAIYTQVPDGAVRTAMNAAAA